MFLRGHESYSFSKFVRGLSVFPVHSGAFSEKPRAATRGPMLPRLAQKETNKCTRRTCYSTWVVLSKFGSRLEPLLEGCRTEERDPTLENFPLYGFRTGLRASPMPGRNQGCVTDLPEEDYPRVLKHLGSLKLGGGDPVGAME